MTIRARAGAIVLVAGLAACRASTPALPPSSSPAAAPAQALVSGTVAYRERMALPPDATVDLWIVDTSPGVGALAIVAETTMAAPGRQVPFPFELRLDPGRVHHERSYGLKAAITAGGQTIFATEQPVPVITHGHPSLVAVMLTRQR